MPDNLRNVPTVISCIAQLIADMEVIEPKYIQEIVDQQNFIIIPM